MKLHSDEDSCSNPHEMKLDLRRFLEQEWLIVKFHTRSKKDSQLKLYHLRHSPVHLFECETLMTWKIELKVLLDETTTSDNFVCGHTWNFLDGLRSLMNKLRFVLIAFNWLGISRRRKQFLERYKYLISCHA